MFISEDGTILTKTEKALAGKSINTTRQFLDRLPYKLIDYTHTLPITQAEGIDAAIDATYISHFYKQGKPSLIRAKLRDNASGVEFAVVWFGVDWMERVLSTYRSEEHMLVCGTVKYDDYGYSISHPSVFESLNKKSADSLLGMKPQYRAIRGVSAEMEEKIRKHLLEDERYCEDSFDKELYNKISLMPLRDVYSKIHFPHSMKEYEDGMAEYDTRQLLAFAYALKNIHAPLGRGIVLSDDSMAQLYEKSLPFEFTKDQKEATERITAHAKEGKQMHLLVQGDVGCGKTAVAIYSLLLAVSNGKQAVLAAPTNVLAMQHFNDINKTAEYFKALGMNINVQFVGSGMKVAEKRAAEKAIADGSANIIVGTHATFSAGYKYKELAVIVVDEEHRFGVAQRDALKNKASDSGVHVISMSATPIPRSLATVLYGETCEIIPIKTMPAGRKPVLTAISGNDASTFSFLKKQISEGRQVYVVCPRVEADDDGGKASVEELKKTYEEAFSGTGITIEVAHGKMKKDELAEALTRFKEGTTQILIATTVIEVGVNVPNSNVIVIENADMFGLATLHQLRGRVGRGAYQSYCVLKPSFGAMEKPKTRERLETLRDNKDGFTIAERDLEMRGTGNLIGFEQSGSSKLLGLMIDKPKLYKRADAIAEWVYQNKEKDRIAAKADEAIRKDIARITGGEVEF